MRTDKQLLSQECILPPAYDYMAGYIFSQKRLVFKNPKQDSKHVYPFNILMACSNDKYVDVHAWTAGEVKVFQQLGSLKQFYKTLPQEIFWYDDRYHLINAVRFTGTGKCRMAVCFDDEQSVDLKRRLAEDLDDVISLYSQRFHAGLLKK